MHVVQILVMVRDCPVVPTLVHVKPKDLLVINVTRQSINLTNSLIVSQGILELRKALN